MFTSVPGAGPQLINHSHVPVFLSLLTACHITEKKKKVPFVLHGRKANIEENFNVLYKKEYISRDIILKNNN